MKRSKAGMIGLLLACVVLFMPIVGCNQPKLDPNTVTQTAARVEMLVGQLEVYQSLINQMATELQTAGALDANSVAKVAKFNDEIDRVKAQAAGVAAAIKNGTYNADDETLITLLKAAQAANAATVPFNPYAGIIGLVLTAVITILGLFAKKKAVAASLAERTLGAVTQAVERVTDGPNKISIKEEVASNLAAAQITTDGKALISRSKVC